MLKPNWKTDPMIRATSPNMDVVLRMLAGTYPMRGSIRHGGGLSVDAAESDARSRGYRTIRHAGWTALH